MRPHSRAGQGRSTTHTRGLRPRTRWQRGAGFALTAVLGTSLAAAAGTPATAQQRPATTGVDVLLEWNTIAQGLTTALRPSAHGQTRGIAMVAGAVYDAVNAIDRGHQPYLLDLRALRIKQWASTDAAIATAAHHVLVSIAPEAQWAALDAAYASSLAAIPDGRSEDEGVRAGAAAATAMVDSRAGDGFMAAFTFNLGSAPGDWRPSPVTALDPDPWVGQLRPFLIRSQDQFRSSGPNSLTSRKYAKEFNEVKMLGSLTSTRRTEAQTKTAIFWQTAPAPLWHGMARDLITRRHLDAVDGARLLGSMSLAGADGAISCWNDKYYWQFWRPVAAIREADTDDNPATVADPAWLPLFDPSTTTTPPLSNPSFPDHPAGHGCVSGATLESVRAFFGTDKVAISVTSGRYPGELRSFSRLSVAMNEVIDARVWGGIHFRTSDVAGADIGKKIGRWADKRYFQSVH
jgi:PAP2 superfamily